MGPSIAPCPLCRSQKTVLLFTTRDEASGRDFHHCSTCDLAFVPRQFHLTERAEKERYLQHNNDPDDQDYRSFLSRLFDPLSDRLKPGATGLDYGAGPGPALAAMMREAGFDVRIYDPFFYRDGSVLETTYDFITCSEVAEHFSDPRAEFERFQALLKPRGWLGVMTGMLDGWREFPGWYYHRDPTHVAFYSRRTMDWIGALLGWRVCLPGRNVALFQKP